MSLHRSPHHNRHTGVYPAAPVVLESPRTGVRVVVGTQALVTICRGHRGPQRPYKATTNRTDLHGWSAEDEIAVLCKAGWREVE